MLPFVFQQKTHTIAPRSVLVAYLRHPVAVVSAPRAEAGHDSLHRTQHVQRRTQRERQTEQSSDSTSNLHREPTGRGWGGGYRRLTQDEHDTLLYSCV